MGSNSKYYRPCWLQFSAARGDKFLARGKQFATKGEYSRAILEFRNAAKAMPKDAEAYYQMGMAYTTARDYRSGLAAFRKAVELNPKHSLAQLRIAEMMAATSDKSLLKEAQDRLKTLLDSAPANPELLNTLASTELTLGETSNAVQSLERAIAQFPGELTSAVLLARAKLMQQDVMGTEAVLQKVVNDSHKYAGAHRVLAQLNLRFHSRGVSTA